MDKQAWRLVCIVILLSPITLLDVPSLVVLLFDMLCLLACMLTITSKRKVIGERFLLSATLPFLLISSYLLFQVTPLSPAFLKLVVPETWQTYQDTIWMLSPGIWMPISIQIEHTIYSWFHICALWAFCIAYGLLIDSHWRLFRFVHVIVLAITLWSVLVILMVTVPKDAAWTILRFNIFLDPQSKLFLGYWIVSFLPVLFAGYTVCRSQSAHQAPPKKFIDYLKSPKISPRVTFLLAICLACIGLLLIFLPVLWFTVLTGYLLFLSFKMRLADSPHFINKKLVHILAFTCTIGMVAWIAFFFSVPTGHDSFTATYASGQDFTLLGYGLGAHEEMTQIRTIQGEGGQTIALRGGLAECLAGMGIIGTFLTMIAILALYHGAGGRESVNKADPLSSTLHSGGIAGLILLLISGVLASAWQWQSMATGLICLTLFTTWCRRLSNLNKVNISHEMSKCSVCGLRVGLGILLAIGAMLTVLEFGPGAIIGHEKPISSVNNDDLSAESSGWRMKTIDILSSYNSELSLALGQMYLMQNRIQEAKAPILMAFRMRPLSPNVHVAVASLSACSGDEDTANMFFATKAATHYTPDNQTKFMVARLLGLPESVAAVKLINLTLEHSPQLASLYLNLMTLYGYEPQELKPLLPESPLVLLALGDLLLSKGHSEDAETSYWQAVYNNVRDLNRTETVYLRVAKYFSETKRLSEALVVANEGVRNNPNSTTLKSLSSDLSKLLGYETH